MRFPSEFRLPLQFGTQSFPILPFIGCPGPAKRRLEFLPAPRGSAHARALRVHRFSLLARAPRGSQSRKVAPLLRQEGRPDGARALSGLPRCIGPDPKASDVRKVTSLKLHCSCCSWRAAAAAAGRAALRVQQFSSAPAAQMVECIRAEQGTCSAPDHPRKKARGSGRPKRRNSGCEIRRD